MKKTFQIVEAVIEENGEIHLLKAVRLSAARRALVTILDEEPATEASTADPMSEFRKVVEAHRPEFETALMRVFRHAMAICTPLESAEASETALLSEQALAEDWSRPEEEEAWSHLQQAP